MGQGYTSGVPISTSTTMSPGTNNLVPSQLAVKTFAVPYTGASGNVDLGANGLTTTTLTLNGATYPGTSSSGKILQSNGTNWLASTPTFPTTAGTSGKILISDGTNIISSTPTYPNAASTSGNVIVSDGTNFVSSVFPSGPQTPTQGLQYCKVTLTNSQIKNLVATPITLVAAAGAGTVIVPISPIYSRLNYGGNSAFTAAASQTIALRYTTGGSNLATVVTNATLTQTSSRYGMNIGASLNAENIAGFENQPILAKNTTATEISGNANNDNTITITFVYFVITIP